jgi:hypothetical protein
VTSGGIDETLEELKALHRTLDERFGSLAERRAGPIFALEHDLNAADLARCRELVREQIRLHIPLHLAWLPFIVYATELGYSFAGEEFWTSFAEATPAWSTSGDREWVRYWFQKFANDYGSVRPAGPWAKSKSIISWPITNAILPTDLQEDLAALLYTARNDLSPALLASPAALGEALACIGSGKYSTRFDVLLGNVPLLGLLAVALLRKEGELDSSGEIEGVTLLRIVADLSRTVSSREQLQAARRRADQVRRGGLSGVPGGTPYRRTQGVVRHSLVSELRLRIEPVADQVWRLAIDVPDLAPLASGHDEVADLLTAHRCRVNGRSGPPLAREYFVHGRKIVNLDSWPDWERPPLDFGSQSSLLDLHVTGDWPLLKQEVLAFLLDDEGSGQLIRSMGLRPNGRYLLLGRGDGRLPGEPASFASGNDRTAFVLRVPNDTEDELRVQLAALGFVVTEEVRAEPVGMPPQRWDDGAGEWLEGDEIMLRLHCSQEMARLSLFVSGIAVLDLHDLATDQIISLGTPPPGVQDVRVSVVLHDGTAVTGNWHVIVNERSAVASAYAPMRVLPDTEGPSLADFWESRSGLAVIGPPGLRVTPHLALMRKGTERPLFEHSFSNVTLPIDRQSWAEMFAPVRDSARASAAVPRATELRVSFDGRNDGLGLETLVCRRESRTVRWFVESRGNEVRLVLENDTDSVDPVRVEVYDASIPARMSSSTTTTEFVEIYGPSSSLLVAHFGDQEVGAINRAVPARFGSLHDLRAAHVVPRIESPALAEPAISRLLTVARRWASGDVFGDVVRRTTRRDVLNALSSRITSTVCGARWADIESRSTREGAPQLAQFSELVFEQRVRRDHEALNVLFDPRWQLRVRSMTPLDRVVALDSLLARHPLVLSRLSNSVFNRRHAVETALRVASAPGSVTEWAGVELSASVNAMLGAPVILRAARYLVLATVSAGEPVGPELYGGWSWL